jgi:hypothetical protein
MSFFGLFEDRLSDRSQIQFDLAKIHLDKENFLQALDTLDQVEATEQEHAAVKALRAQIHEELDASLDEANDADSFSVTEMSGNRIVIEMAGFDQERIQEYTDKGYIVESCAYGETWVIVLCFNEDSDYTQEFMLLESFTEESFNEYHAAGYYITQGASDGERWFFVFEQHDDWQDQFWIASPGEVPRKELKEWEEAGYWINILLEANDHYFGTAVQLEESVSFDSQKSQDDPADCVPAIWDEGKWIARMYSIEGNILYFYHKDEQIEIQGVSIGAPFPYDQLEERYKEGQSIEQLLYTSFGWVVLTQKKKL